MELFLTNRVLDSSEALEWGLVNQVVDDKELAEAVDALSARLAEGPAGAFKALKRLVGDAMTGFETQLGRESLAISSQVGTPEGLEGIGAFLDKRMPRFRSALDRHR
jgi:2-(1,2-epoxy-1,2-dihydrophenyl)acetyl-CoA isomerase